MKRELPGTALFFKILFEQNEIVQKQEFKLHHRTH